MATRRTHTPLNRPICYAVMMMMMQISAVAFAAYVHLKLPRVPKGAFRVPILPGYRRGTKITFNTPEGVDVTFELVEKHSQFRRSGKQLVEMLAWSVFFCFFPLSDIINIS